MQERRLCKLVEFKRLRSDKGKDKVKLVRDKLIGDGKVVDPRFEKNPIKPSAAAMNDEDIEWV